MNMEEWMYEDCPVVNKSVFLNDTKGEYIQRNDIVYNKARKYKKAARSDLDDFVSCSPVLETWARWDSEITRSGTMTLSTFSNDENTVQLLTDYMHGAKIMVTTDVLPALLSLADMLQVDDVTNNCKFRIQNQTLNTENCLQILKTCSLYDIEHPQMDTFIRGNLIELSQRKDMLDITPDALEILLADEELSYWPMDDKFIFLSDWCSARDDRALQFETWFKYLDLYKIDRNIIEKIVKNEKLVSGSKHCLDLVKKHLQERQDNPVPFVFVLNDIRTGSNVLGFNVNDKELYKFNFPDQMIDSEPITVVGSGHILAMKKTIQKTYVYDYDINNNICKKKVIQCRERLPNKLSHILDANGRLMLIFDKAKGLYPSKEKRAKRGSILYQQVSDDGKVIKIEPLLTFRFDVSCACFSQPMIIVSSKTNMQSSKLVCFHLDTNSITEKDIRIPPIRCMLALPGKLFLSSFADDCLILEWDTESNRYNIKDATPKRSRGYEIPNKTIFCSGFIIEIYHKSISLNDTRSDNIDMKNSETYNLEQLRFGYPSTISCGYLESTKPLCHIMCPHCDPDAWGKEERRRLQEQYRFERSDYDDDDCLDYNDDYYDDEYYDDDYNDGWDQKELIWDGSADEFVEAWW